MTGIILKIVITLIVAFFSLPFPYKLLKRLVRINDEEWQGNLIATFVFLIIITISIVISIVIFANVKAWYSYCLVLLHPICWQCIWRLVGMGI